MEPTGGEGYVTPMSPRRPPGGSSRLKWLGVLAGFAVLVAVVLLQRHSGNAPAAADGLATTSSSESTLTGSPVATTGSTAVPTPATTTASQTDTAPTATSPRPTAEVTAPFTGFGGDPPVGSTSTAPSVSGLATTLTTLPAGELPTSKGWDLLVFGDASLVTIDTASGRVVSVPVDVSLGGYVPAYLIPGPGRTLMGGWGSAGTMIPDGGPSTPAPGLLLDAPQVAPGPDSGHLWVAGNDPATAATVRLVDWRGRPTGTTITLPRHLADGNAYIQPDGGGYLLVSGVGGWYDARPGSIRLVTHGEILAVGPAGFLVYECGDTPSCQAVLVSRTSGARRIIPGMTMPHVGVYTIGSITPDGSRAVFTTYQPGEDDTMGSSLRVVDLGNGKDVLPPSVVAPDVGYANAPLALSPDGSELIVSAQGGSLLLVDTVTGRVRPLHVPSLVPTALALATRLTR